MHGPTVDLNYVDLIAIVDLEGLNPDYKETIRQRVLKLSVDNQDHMYEPNH